MPEPLFTLLAFALALGSGLIAGAFFAFSSFVMKALARLPAPQGVSAMQAINIVVINPVFLGVFLGTAILALGAIPFAALQLDYPGSGPLLGGAVIYLAGCFGVTMVGNVPLNNELALASPESADAPRIWQKYLIRWQRWNHVRTLAALAASAASIWCLRAV